MTEKDRGMSDNLGPNKEPEKKPNAPAATPANNPPSPEADPEAEAHAKKMAELFGDLDDEDGEETIDDIRAERDELRQKLADMSGRMSRMQQDNLALHQKAEEAKKIIARTEEKFENDKKFAVEKFVKEILPVIDTLELGLQAIPAKDRESDPKFAKLADGVEKTLTQLTGVFNKFGIKQINPINEEFDANKHEALATQPRPDTEPETVIHVAQKGYEIEGRLIRPAKVIVTPAD
jgi:molecular chaperone GrpE